MGAGGEAQACGPRAGDVRLDPEAEESARVEARDVTSPGSSDGGREWRRGRGAVAGWAGPPFGGLAGGARRASPGPGAGALHPGVRRGAWGPSPGAVGVVVGGGPGRGRLRRRLPSAASTVVRAGPGTALLPRAAGSRRKPQGRCPHPAPRVCCPATPRAAPGAGRRGGPSMWAPEWGAGCGRGGTALGAPRRGVGVRAWRDGAVLPGRRLQPCQGLGVGDRRRPLTAELREVPAGSARRGAKQTPPRDEAASGADAAWRGVLGGGCAGVSRAPRPARE